MLNVGRGEIKVNREQEKKEILKKFKISKTKETKRKKGYWEIIKKK